MFFLIQYFEETLPPLPRLIFWPPLYIYIYIYIYVYICVYVYVCVCVCVYYFCIYWIFFFKIMFRKVLLMLRSMKLMYDVTVCVFDDIWFEMFTHSGGDDFSFKCVSSEGAALTMGAMNTSKNEIAISLPIWGHDIVLFMWHSLKCNFLVRKGINAKLKGRVFQCLWSWVSLFEVLDMARFFALGPLVLILCLVLCKYKNFT